MKKLIISSIVAATLAASGSAMAVATSVIATENFQSASNGGSGGNGGTGWAASSAWQSTPNSSAPAGSAPAVVTDALGDKSLQFSSDREYAAFRNLGAAVSNDVLIRFEFKYTGNALGNNDFLSLWFGNPDGPSIGVKGNCGATNCSDDTFVRLNLGSNAMLGGVNIAADTTYVMFGHLYKSAGSSIYNKFDAWVNPTADEMLNLLTPDAKSSIAINTAGGLSSFNTMGFRSANLNTGGVNILVDDIELSVVPEPASIALFGTAMLAMAGLRRRRQK